MRIRHLVTACLATLLAACGTVDSESSSSIVVDRRSYELRTSVVTDRTGTFARSRVIVNNKAYTCLPESPGDCEATVRLARSESRGDR